MKKGAMFGLDARIALAIFGALSVISGAALYSAIQNAHTEKLRQQLNEIVKATEAYYLDTGIQLPYPSSRPILIGNLVKNYDIVAGWQGPYLSYESAFDSSIVNSILDIPASLTKEIKMVVAKSSTWPSGSMWCTVGDLDCSQWITINGTASADFTALFNRLDSLIDGGDGDKAGNMRMYTGVPDSFLAYRALPRKRTH
jgi:type II secretory pathway pseudopilin PulG